MDGSPENTPELGGSGEGGEREGWGQQGHQGGGSGMPFKGAAGGGGGEREGRAARAVRRRLGHALAPLLEGARRAARGSSGMDWSP